MTKPKIKRGQIWKQKSNGIMLKIDGGSGTDWFGYRVGMGEQQAPKTHHITLFMLYRKWELVV